MSTAAGTARTRTATAAVVAARPRRHRAATSGGIRVFRELGPVRLQGRGIKSLRLSPNRLQQLLFGVSIGVIGRHRIRLCDPRRLREHLSVLEQGCTHLARFGGRPTLRSEFAFLGGHLIERSLRAFTRPEIRLCQFGFSIPVGVSRVGELGVHITPCVGQSERVVGLQLSKLAHNVSVRPARPSVINHRIHFPYLGNFFATSAAMLNALSQASGMAFIACGLLTPTSTPTADFSEGSST